MKMVHLLRVKDILELHVWYIKPVSQRGSGSNEAAAEAATAAGSRPDEPWNTLGYGWFMWMGMG